MRVFLFLVGVGILSSLTFPLFLFILDWAGIVSLEAPTLWLSVFYSMAGPIASSIQKPRDYGKAGESRLQGVSVLHREKVAQDRDRE